jgi:lysophospholipase L1-like esterase
MWLMSPQSGTMRLSFKFVRTRAVEMENTNKHIVVCLGASMVRGQVSCNFVRLLDQRMGENGFQFINAGVAGDQAYNVLMRLDTIIAYRPDSVIILVGTNDVTATLSPALGRISRLTRKFPQPPSAEFYHSNMLRIVKTLRERTPARIALVSLPILGEDLESIPNQRIREFNALLREIAKEEQVGYLPVYELQEEYLRRVQPSGGRPYESGGMLSIKALAHHYLLRQSFDEISRKHHFLLLTDGIHMNCRGATFIVEEVESFLLTKT